MTHLSSRVLRAVMLVLLPLTLAGCGVNAIPTKQEIAKAKFADVQSQYQRRADLIPNLVNTVQAFAQQERTVLVQVTQARASATQVKVGRLDPDRPPRPSRSIRPPRASCRACWAG